MAGKRQKLRPYVNPGSSHYIARFYDPRTGKQVGRGLGTCNLDEAREICLHLDALLEDADEHGAPRWLYARFLNPKALRAYFGNHLNSSLCAYDLEGLTESEQINTLETFNAGLLGALQLEIQDRSRSIERLALQGALRDLRLSMRVFVNVIFFATAVSCDLKFQEAGHVAH